MPILETALADAPSPSVLAAMLGDLPEPSGRDRRAHERLGAHELDWLKTARLRFGPPLSLIDLSAGGAQFETSAPLRPGASAVLTISGRGIAETASFRVLRCEVSSVQQGSLVYRGACVFDRIIQIPGASSQGPVTLREDPAIHEDVVRLIRSLAARTPDPARLNRLIMEIRTAVARGESPETVLHFIERQLAGSPAPPPLVRHGGVSPVGRTTGSVVQTPVPFAPRTAAAPEPAPARAPVAATSAVAAAAAASPAAPLTAPPPAGMHAKPASAWNKLVVRYLDGSVLKGFSQDFHTTRPFFHLAASITPGAETSMVPMAQLKAVFFVRDFDGDPSYVERRTFEERIEGRKIEVTFADGELMAGSTLGYRPDGAGFFVRPADADANNLRVFVLPGGLKRIRYI